MTGSSTAKSAWAVAKWEFGRYCKLRDQLIGMLSLLIGGCIGIGAVKISQSNSKITLVTNQAALLEGWPKDSQITLVVEQKSSAELRDLVLEKKFDAALAVPEQKEQDWELLVRSEPVWLDQVKLHLNQRKAQSSMISEGISPESLAKVFSPATIAINNVLPNTTSKADKALAMSVLVMVMLTSWLGLAYMLTGISGEKQQRVTEQIVSAISAQAWIDGKLLGITAASLASTANLVFTGILAGVVAKAFGFELPMPASIGRLDLIACILVFCLGSVFLWNCFYASVASVINDPNTSARSSLMFLPVLPMATAAVAMAKPDGLWMRVLSIMPGSSATAMPIRLLIGHVPMWELVSSLLALLAAIVILRTIAGRVFRAGILLTGKEPSWLEIARWSLRSTPS